MQNVTLIGMDLGKHAFHLHGQDKAGKAVFRRKVSRKQLFEFFAAFQQCTVVMEACVGAHYMARKLMAFGHEIKLISPQFVRPFVKSNKNGFVDAEAICEAASRPSMRFVTPKTESQQTLSALHRVRDALVRDKVRTTNALGVVPHQYSTGGRPNLGISKWGDRNRRACFSTATLKRGDLRFGQQVRANRMGDREPRRCIRAAYASAGAQSASFFTDLP
jgi:hypothetical protein